MSSLFQTNKVDKATALARTYARSTIAPQNIKRAVVWEHYWRLRTRASREIRRHREKIASLKHLRKETDAFMRAADIRGDHLTKIDCEIFILALQVMPLLPPPPHPGEGGSGAREGCQEPKNQFVYLQGAYRALCGRCAKSWLFSTTGSSVSSED